MVGKWLNKLSEVGFLHGGDHFTLSSLKYFLNLFAINHEWTERITSASPMLT